ncbi:hypothetical protein ACS126_08175 [Sphingobacterium lactis]|uniref:hypothetical protein n=1 Tax=Sphingobacterium TaxID=28453 RepID=UPI0021A79CF6|nr:hypothetical protein [Sphingobacterium daejeonense]MCT1532164.1 hypothetical protein [Sphingobacterium daejeonense]
MKLSKSRLIKLLKPSLEALGYKEFKDSILGCQGCFCKKVENDYYLTLGMIIHRYYDYAFTGEFYLSKTTRWSTVWGDIPKKSFERPGYFLTQEELASYKEDLVNVSGNPDIWWNGGDEQSVIKFLDTIKLTEVRFLRQPNLIKEISQSKIVEKMYLYGKETERLVRKGKLEEVFKFVPSKEKDDIPVEWFKASEIVLRRNNAILNSRTVALLAADAFKRHHLDNEFN